VSYRFRASSTEATPKLKSVVGPNGGPLLLSDLPSADHKHWTKRNKLEVAAAVRGGLLSLSEACSRYRMSEEEFRTWEKAARKLIYQRSRRNSCAANLSSSTETRRLEGQNDIPKDGRQSG
jgi:hypothetical protein